MMSGISTLQVNERRPSFLVRQFAIEPTKAQNNFDFAFGVFLPVVCFMFDPIVFKTGAFLGGAPLAAKYQGFAYMVSAIQMVALLAWVMLRRHLLSFSGPISGVLIVGGLFSLVIGVLILPYSLLGLIFLIGAAGFTPFVTSFVYLRSGIRGLRSHEMNSANKSRFQVALASGVIALALPVFVSMQVSRAVSISIDSLLNW